MDAYAALAAIYDDWQERYGCFAELARGKLERTLARHARPGTVSSFLDLGCGTGSLLVGLERAHPGWRLCGLDGSAAMLAEAQAKPSAGRIVWLRGALEPGPPPEVEPFDAAGSFFDSLNHLPDAAALGRAFAGVARALVPGGLFVFDLSNRLGFERWWRGERAYRGDGWSFTVESRFGGDDVAHGRVVVTQGARRAEGEVRERCYDPAEVRGLLAAAGLEVVEAEPWSPFALDEPGKTWWVARLSGERVVSRRSECRPCV